MTKGKIKNTSELVDLIATMDVIEKHIQPTTKNNLGVDYTINGLDDFIEFGKKAFGVELTIKKSDNPDTYKNDLSSGLDKNSKKLERDYESDCISRADARKAIIDHQYSDSFCEEHSIDHSINTGMALIALSDLPPATPQEPRKGEWLRMSDLSEQDDYRYKCSRCGNVINHKSKMDLYTFNSWCGRCGSDNSRHINCEVEDGKDD